MTWTDWMILVPALCLVGVMIWAFVEWDEDFRELCDHDEAKD